ncbi:hypothetical protein Nepgr_031525 [Nepenthes gracilis]|uniref:Transmembrane protein n=1 Tax=Nepenthes gracilis TaxID=150966 RepID=A0AAD3Y4W6_NEPGR|nr:hypothetical protein Nepgr_031525 [Nepenthes gracilis]
MPIRKYYFFGFLITYAFTLLFFTFLPSNNGVHTFCEENIAPTVDESNGSFDLCGFLSSIVRDGKQCEFEMESTQLSAGVGLLKKSLSLRT